jgi:long-subunit acyl-CoA synthetase (AMP-forming)
MHVVRGLNEVTRLPSRGRIISWLPTAHIAERAFHYYFPVLLGSTITTCPNPREIIGVLGKVKPDFFFAVPRVWEKMKAGLEAQLASLPAAQRERIEAAVACAREKVRLEQAGRPVPAEVAAKAAAAETAVLSQIRALIGLDQVVVAGVGAAPTPYDVLEFFRALGVPLGEGWGMSETCGVGTLSPPDQVRLGTVGRALPGVEIRIAEDGEVLIRGGNIMCGYRNQPDKTAETIDARGWLATGDIGELDADGYLRIVDRKKELIINAAGKNMSPANIEAAIKTGSPLIGQVCVVGDRRPYNTALIVLDADYTPSWAARHGLEGTPLEALATEPAVVAAVHAGVDAGNATLSRVEQVKRFTIIPGDWPPGGDELTPTMKLKRKPIGEKYAAEIEKMYAG